MYTSLKGQGLIGQIIVFSVSIMMAVGFLFVLTTTGVDFEEEVEMQVEASKDAVAEASAIHMSKSTEMDDYSTTPYILASRYFSTDQDVLVDGEEVDREDVREDLEDHFDDSLDGYLSERPGSYEYVLRIEGDGEEIEVGEGDGTGWNHYSLPLAAAGDENPEIKLWIREEE